MHTDGIENAAAAGEDDSEAEYLDIAVKVPMACAKPATADRIAALPLDAGDAAADYLDALTVASDMLVRHERGGGFARHVLFVTDLRTRCEIDDEFIAGIAAGMKGASVRLTVAVVDGDGDAATTSEADEETKRVNRAMLQGLCDVLNEASGVAAASMSGIQDAVEALQVAQTKLTKPTTTFRGDLEFTPFVSLKVWVYKKVSEAKPPSMKLRVDDDESGGAHEPNVVVRERSFKSYADPDNPVSVPSEMMISAYPYGPTNIPIQDDVAALVASKNDKGMKIFGFTPLDTVPQWLGMDEARILVPWPGREQSVAAGMAASAGFSPREAGKAAAAMSALARAMERKGVAALTRAVWTQNSDKVNFGALTPHITAEGDFLLFVPLPYSEDMYSSDFKPLPALGTDAAGALAPALAAKLVPTEEQKSAAAALVDALDGNGPDPWTRLNPALTRTHALIHARAVNELAAPLAPPSGTGPDAVRALVAPPLAGRAGLLSDAKDTPAAAAAAAAAAAFKAACGGLALVEKSVGWKGLKRGAAEALPPGEGDRGGDGEKRPRQDEVVGASGGERDGDDAAAAAAEHPPESGAGARETGDGDAWVVVKQEPNDDVALEDEDDVVAAEPPPPVEDDGFFDDMD